MNPSRHTRRSLRDVARLRWSPTAAIVFCALLGTLFPAAFGLLSEIPGPLIHDEHSYLLGADTFAQGRLTNPSLPLPEFFEAPHILVTPTYQSKYPPGQALILALGTVMFGHPIWGVWLGCGLYAGALCWMLQGWVSRRWAIAVTVISVATLGTTTYWAQSYWGGMLAAAGAALTIGGTRRTLRRPSVISSVIVGLGSLILAVSRPFEGVLALIPAAVLLGRWLLQRNRWTFRQKLTRFVAPVGVVTVLGLGCLAGYNQTVTGIPWTAPYRLHLDQYFHQGVFLFSPLREPERQPVERIATIYRQYATAPKYGFDLARNVAGNFVSRLLPSIAASFGLALGPNTLRPPYIAIMLWAAFLVAVIGRRPGPFLGFLIGGTIAECIAWFYRPEYPWIVALFVLAGVLMLWRGRWIGFFSATAATVVVGQAFIPWWFSHYIAPATPVIVAGVASSVQRASWRARGRAMDLGPVVLTMVAAHVVTLLLLHEGFRDRWSAAKNTIGARGPVVDELTRIPGPHLVFVEYDRNFTIQREWVYNPANLADAPIIFAHDLGDATNPQLMALYPDRSVWRLNVSAAAWRLEHYRVVSGPDVGEE